MGQPPFPLSGPFLSTGYLVGTPLDWFDLQQALAPGMTEDTRLKQLNKALQYWQSLTPLDTLTATKQTYAVMWIQAEITRVTNPPTNNLHVVYPV